MNFAQECTTAQKVTASSGPAGRPSSSAELAKLRPARFDDYSQIAALQARNGLCPESREKWLHLYADNPVYSDRPGVWHIGWVLEAKSGDIVGYLGNIPVRYELQGKALTAISGRAWVVDPGFRAQSISLLNEKLRQQHVDLFLYTTAGPTSSRIFELLRMSRVPAGRWDTSAFWITNYTGFGSSLLALKAPAARHLAGFGAGATLFVADRFRRISTDFTQQIEITTCTSFDQRFDEFWDKLRITRGEFLLGVRTREVLDWHFKFPLRNGELWIATIVDKGVIVAYAILLRQDVPRLGLKRIRVVDIQSLKADQQTYLAFLGWALDRCRKERIHMLEYVGLSPQSGIVRQMAPHVRTLPSWTYFYHATDKLLAETLNHSEVWDPFLFDGDASF